MITFPGTQCGSPVPGRAQGESCLMNKVTEQGGASSSCGLTSSEQPGLISKQGIAPPRLVLESLETEFTPKMEGPVKMVQLKEEA